jgi:glutamyl-tRNA reductase
MDPILVTFRTPNHDPALVARHVVRRQLSEHLQWWKGMTHATELVYLATCQRVLWILWEGEAEALGLGHGADILRGEAAWRHLLEVATGLNSANLGDREITGQLRNALRTAREAGTAGGEAQALMEDLLREAQRLRTRIGLSDGSASVATAALRVLEARLAKGSRVALVGAGPMSRYLAERLPERGYEVVLSNRTLDKVDGLGLPTISLESLRSDPADFHALVTATASPDPLFTLQGWSRHARGPLVLMDLAMPCDSEPTLAQLPWIRRTDLQDLLCETEQGRARRREAACQAEPLLVGAVQRLRQRAGQRIHKHHLRSAHERLGASWEALVAEALEPGSPLAGLDAGQREALEELLRRGRTLAYRTLSLGGEPFAGVG